MSESNLRRGNRYKKKATAAELMRRLSADPAFVEHQARAHAERAKKEAEFRTLEAEVVRDLRDAGLVVDSVWDLVNCTWIA
jgi:hypothetical protein